MRAPQWKLLAVTLVAIPFVIPPLVVAYGYLNVFLNLASRPWLVELVYAALVWVRVMPVAVFARMVLSPLLSSESRFCQDLLGFVRRPGTCEVSIAPCGTWGLGGGVLVLVFHEFELASLWQRPAWTVAMFDFECTSKSISQSVIDWFLLLLACLIPVDVGLRLVQLDWSTVGPWFKRKNQEGSVDTLTALLQSKERMANKQKRKTALATAQKTTSPPGGKGRIGAYC